MNFAIFAKVLLPFEDLKTQIILVRQTHVCRYPTRLFCSRVWRVYVACVARVCVLLVCMVCVARVYGVCRVRTYVTYAWRACSVVVVFVTRVCVARVSRAYLGVCQAHGQADHEHEVVLHDAHVRERPARLQRLVPPFLLARLFLRLYGCHLGQKQTKPVK